MTAHWSVLSASRLSMNVAAAGAALTVMTALPIDAQTTYDYRVLATSKTSTLEKELRDAGAAGYEVMGMTVAKTAIGGKEIVAITRRAR